MEQCTDVMQGEHRLQIVISFNSFLYIFRALLQSYHFLLIKAKSSADASGLFTFNFVYLTRVTFLFRVMFKFLVKTFRG